MGRVAAFIDGGLFTDAVRGQGMSMDIDLRDLVASLVPDDQLVGIQFVVPEYPSFPYPAKHFNEKKRLDQFASQGIEILLTKPQLIGSVFIDRGVEALLTANLITGAHHDNFDTALVISRRVELKVAIEAVRKIGKDVKVSYFAFETPGANSLFDLVEEPIVIDICRVLAHRKSGPTPPLY